MSKTKNGFHEVFGVELRRVTSILGRLSRYGLETWQATTAVDYMMRELVLPLQRGWMSFDQLKETDLEKLREAAMDEARKRMKSAQIRGRRVHEVIHDYCKAGQRRSVFDSVLQLEPELKPAIEGFIKWEDDFKVEIVGSERQVFSFSRKYAGTLDQLAKITLLSENYEDGPRRLYVIDVKTGNPDPIYVLQLAAYVVAVEEMDRIKVDGAGLLYLDQETGRPRWKGFERHELFLPFLLFEKIKGFVELEDEWKKRGDFEEGPPSVDHASPADAPPADTPAGSPTFE